MGELSLLDCTLSTLSPSCLAAAAVLLSAALVRRQPLELTIAPTCSRSKQLVRGCTRVMYALVKRAEDSDQQAVFRKFSHPARHAVAQVFRRSTMVQSNVVFQHGQDCHSENRSVNRCAPKRPRDNQEFDDSAASVEHSAGTITRGCLQMALCSIAFRHR